MQDANKQPGWLYSTGLLQISSMDINKLGGIIINKNVVKFGKQCCATNLLAENTGNIRVNIVKERCTIEDNDSCNL